jgi:outer membrane protein assembly factor BamA
MTVNPLTSRSLVARFRPALYSALLLIIAFNLVDAQQARKIAKIEIEGLQQLALNEVISTAGLKVGIPFSVQEVDEAGQRLMDSGLFTKVGYRTRTSGNLVTIVFQVEEGKSSASPVVFDNFVWFTNEELYIAIKREVPSFNGTAPDSGTMTDQIKLALQNLLQQKQIKGTVEYAPWQAGLNSARQEHLFSVTGVPIPICKLQFPGAKNLSDETLIKNSKQLIEADYSLKSAIAFGTFILYPLYREEGQWRAKFGEPTPKLEGTGNCKDGVTLTIPVEEGPIYLLDKAEWNGNQILTADALNEALGIKPGDVLKGSKFEKGILAINEAYGRIGHLDANAKALPTFDDAASRATLKIDVKEGPRYTMGNLIVKGASEADARALQEAWKLRRSEVFSTAYLDQFFRFDGREAMQRVATGRQEMGRPAPRVQTDIKKNLQSLTADVVLEFKDV